MERITCPHCNKRQLPLGRIAKQVVAVMSCPCTEQLVVVYRDKVMPLDRRILESGTRDERKEHLAGIIAEFLEEGPWVIDGNNLGAAFGGASNDLTSGEIEELPDLSEGLDPISDTEFDKFIRVDLKCLDNGAYFRRHFR